MTAALGALLWQRRGSEQLAGELCGGADVHQRSTLVGVAKDVVAEGSPAEVGLGQLEIALRVGGHLGRDRKVVGAVGTCARRRGS